MNDKSINDLDLGLETTVTDLELDDNSKVMDLDLDCNEVQDKEPVLLDLDLGDDVGSVPASDPISESNDVMLDLDLGVDDSVFDLVARLDVDLTNIDSAVFDLELDDDLDVDLFGLDTENSSVSETDINTYRTAEYLPASASLVLNSHRLTEVVFPLLLPSGSFNILEDFRTMIADALVPKDSEAINDSAILAITSKLIMKLVSGDHLQDMTAKDILNLNLFDFYSDIVYDVCEVYKLSCSKDVEKFKSPDFPQEKKVLSLAELIDNEYTKLLLYRRIGECIAAYNRKIASAIDEQNKKLKVIHTTLESNISIEHGEEYCFTGEVNLNENTFKCGHCGKESPLVRPYIEFLILHHTSSLVHPGDAISNLLGSLIHSKSINGNYFFIYNSNHCSECQHDNILSYSEQKELTEYLTTLLEQSSIKTLSSMLKEYNKYIGLSLYRFSNMQLTYKLPGVFTYDVGSEEQDVVSLETSYNDFDSAVARYLKFLGYLKEFSGSNLDFAVTDEDVSNLTRLGTETIDKETSVVVSAPTIHEYIPRNLLDTSSLGTMEVSEDVIRNSQLIAKCLCNTLSNSYEILKRDAIYSLVDYIKTTPLKKIIYFKSRFLELSACCIANVDEFFSSFYGSNDTMDILEDTARFFNINLEGYISDGKFNDDLLNKFKEEIRVALNASEQRYKAILDISQRCKELTDLSYLYSYLPIRKNIAVDDIEMYLYGDFNDFIDYTTNLMIIRKLSSPYYDVIVSMEDLNTNKSLKITVNTFKKLLNTADPDKQKTIDGVLELFRLKYHKANGKSSDFFHSISDIIFNNFQVSAKTLRPFTKVYSSYILGDRFNINNSIAECESIFEKPFEYPYNVFNFVVSFLSSAREFVREHGSTEVDRLYYYLGNEFTYEEIEKSFSSKYNTVTFSFIPTRLEGESLRDYIYRYTQLEEDPDYIPNNTVDMSFIHSFDEYIPELCCIGLPYSFILNNGDIDIGKVDFMFDLLYFSCFTSEGEVYTSLNLPKDWVSGLGQVNNPDLKLNKIDFNQVACEILAESTLYPSLPLNILKSDMDVSSKTKFMNIVTSDEFRPAISCFKDDIKEVLFAYADNFI